MQLWNHQKKLIELNPKKYALVFGTGMGKTLTAIELAKKNNQVPLIICPKSILEQWEEQAVRFGLKEYTILTKEQFKKKASILPKYNCLLIDECHHFLSPNLKSQLYKSLLAYIKVHNVEYIYGLSATVYLSTPWNIFALAKILGYEPNYNTWRRLYFNQFKMGRQIIYVPKKGIEDEMAKIVNKIGMTVKMEDCTDIPEQIFLKEYFDLGPEQRKAIKELIDLEPIVRWSKTFQIENGTLKGDGYTNDQFFKCEKLNRVIDLIEQNKKIAIFCRHKLEVKAIQEKVKKKCYVISGDVKDRHEIVKQIEADDNAVALIISACSEGFELPSVPVIVYYSMSLKLSDWVQSQGRFLRLNALKTNTIINLINRKGTIDYDIYDNVVNKKMDYHFSIYDNINI